MAKNTGRPYEILTREIFDQLVNSDGVRTIIKGITASHQVDVYWKFEIGGIEHQALVQAKDWKNSVEQHHVLAFKSILDDIPGQPRGIMVARTGFQSGATQYADAHGILLYELREPDNENMAGRIRRIIVNLTIFHPVWSKIRPINDGEWGGRELQRLGLPSEYQIQISHHPSELVLVDADGHHLGTIDDLIRKELPPKNEVGHEVREHRFPSETFMLTPWAAPMERLKVLGIVSDIDVTASTRTIVVDSNDFVCFVLQRLSDGKSFFLKTDGTVVDPDRTS